MNSENLRIIPTTSYPSQSFDPIVSNGEQKQLLMHSVCAVNGVNAENSMGIAHTNVAEADYTDPAEVRFLSKEKFELICFNISVADSGGGNYSFEYYNGSTFVALEMKFVPDFTVVGRQNALFFAPIDWALLNGFFEVRMIVDAAPNYTVATTKICQMIVYREGILPKQTLEVCFDVTYRQLLLQSGEQIIGFFALPSSSNSMEASYQINP